MRSSSTSFFTIGPKRKPKSLLQKDGDDAANAVIATMDKMAVRMVQLKDEVYFNGRAGESQVEIDRMNKEAEEHLWSVRAVASRP